MLTGFSCPENWPFIELALFCGSAEIFDSSILPSSPGGGLQKDSLFPVSDNPKTQKNPGQSHPYTGLTVLNPEYRPWN